MNKTSLLVATFVGLLICAGIAPTTTAVRRSQGPQGPVVQDGPGRRLRALSLSKNSVIGGTKFSGSVALQFIAPSGGTRVHFSQEPAFNPEGGNAAFVPSGVTLSQGESSAAFEINTFPVQQPRQVTINATAGGVTRTATFTVQPIQVAGFVITPTLGIGPFQSTAAITLNAPATSELEVTLTTSNSDVIGFGILGTQPTRTVTFQEGQRSLTNIPLASRSVQQRTTVTITASLNGSTQSRPMTVNPRP